MGSVCHRNIGFAFLIRAIMATVAIVLSVLSVPALGQSSNDGYFPLTNGEVFAMALQPDGRLIIGGEFTTVNGTPRQGLARLHVDGTLDLGFNGQLGDGRVFDIAIQDNGQILIGGSFTQIGVSQRNRIARLNPDGSLDPGFNPGANGSVRALAVQADGRILVGGAFSTIAGQSQQRLARLHVNGSADAGFTPAVVGGSVLSLRIQSDGRILAGGVFSSINGLTKHNIARLYPSGTTDLSFVGQVLNGEVHSIDIHLDGRILVGGGFTQVNGVERWNFARLLANGEIDYSTDLHNFNSDVHSVRVLLDGSILVAGRFSLRNESFCSQVARIQYNGVFERCLSADHFSSLAYATVEQSDGKVVVGSLNSSSGQRLYRWGLFNSRDESSVSSFNGRVNTLTVQGEGRLLVGGNFTETAPGSEVRNLVRLNHTFAEEINFGQPNPNLDVYSISVQANGMAVVGGAFTTISGQPRNYLARLSQDGFLDPSFNPAPDNLVTATLIQPDGKILVAGMFDQIAGAPQRSLARLLANGSIDPPFAVAIDDHEQLDGRVLSMALQADGRILIGGTFSMIGDVPRFGLARLMPDGSLDTGFVPIGSLAQFVVAIHVLPNGQILVSDGSQIQRLQASGTVDNSFGPVNVSGSVTSMLVTADHRILIGGLFTAVNGTSRQHVARLNANGSLDTSFLANANGNLVSALGLQTDGRLLLGGQFSGVAGGNRANFDRLSVPDAALQSLEVIGDQVRWSMSGGIQQPAMPPQLQFSLDGSNFVTVATMQPMAGGWQVSGFEPPHQQAFYLRVLAQVQQGYRNGSMGQMRSPVHQFYVTRDRLFADRFKQ